MTDKSSIEFVERHFPNAPDKLKKELIEISMAKKTERAANKIRLAEILSNSKFLDEDGYPTEDALEAIKIWDHRDSLGWFAFIKDIWHLKSWGWTEVVTDQGRRAFNISTGGWSGNESIINAMQDNFLWDLRWVQSRRGGHYIFETKINDTNESCL